MQGSVTALKAAPKLHNYNSSRNINSVKPYSLTPVNLFLGPTDSMLAQ